MSLSIILLQIPRNPITALGLPLSLGILSGLSTSKVVRKKWYQNLIIPPGRPSPQTFQIVWPLLYLSMGYASHLAVKSLDVAMSASSKSNLTLGIKLYYVQLGLNLIWSPLFFNAKQTGWALVDSILLVGITSYMTKLLAGPTHMRTSPFLIPYCAWLVFATYLNGGIWWLNRGRHTTNKE